MRTIVNTEQATAWNGWEGALWAEHPDRYNGMVSGFNDALFTAAAIGERDRVLDVGCGTGETALLAARRAGCGHVVGIDLSAVMLERARVDAARAGIANVTFEEGDAQVHPFPDGGFDVAVSRGGVMFFSDAVAAFTNIGRSLRAGGRLAFIGPQAPDADSHYGRATAALSPLMRGPSPAQRGMMSLVDQARIGEVLTGAGFVEVNIASAKATMMLGRDAADAADFIFATGPVRFNLDGVDDAAVTHAREEVRAQLRGHETADGIRLEGAVWLVTATCP